MINKMIRNKKKHLVTYTLLLALTVVSLVLILSACASDWGITDLPPLDPPDKGNPKLDSVLNQLVLAEKRGEATAFAAQSSIELNDGSIRVIIESVPGRLEEAKEVASDANARIETSYNNLLQVVVPISGLLTLAESESIDYIRLPHTPWPDK